MKKLFTLLTLTGLFAAAHAEVVKNPDANTLWLENGKNIVTSPKNTYKDYNWWLNKVKLTPHQQKGFVIEGSGTIGVYVRSSKEYSWLCLDIASVDKLGKGYHALSVLPAAKTQNYGVVSRIPRGTYYHSLAASPEMKDKASSKFMRMDISSAKIHFNSVSMVKAPPCIPTVEPATVKKCDTVTVRCKLAKKPQYVELKFYQAYTMPNLKPAKDMKRCEAKEVPGSNGLEWTFSFPYQGFVGATRGREKNGFKSGEVLLQIILEDDEKVSDLFFFLPNTFQ
jgi:hypothetical protein